MEILTTFVIAFLILAAPVGFSGSKHYWVTVVAYLFFAFIALMGTFNLALGFCLASIVILLALRGCRVTSKWVIGIMCLWTLVLPTAGLLTGVREHQELQAKYPIESFSERLAYEVPPAVLQTPNESATDPEPDNEDATPQTWPRNSDDSQRAQRRKTALEQFHSLTFSQFVSAFGFGANRMTEIQRHFLDYEPTNPPPLERFPKRSPDIGLHTAIEKPLLVGKGADGPVGGPRPSQFEVVQQFTSSLAWTHVASQKKAAGFEPHGLIQIPSLYGSSRDDWQISRLDLVSLLKFAEPRVYLSEHLPRMEELRNAETRPVDEFEQRALQQLRDGENIAVDQQLNSIRMVGAVRAAKQCLDCHSARRGELLGAFSYLLDRKSPIPPPKAAPKPVSMIWRIPHDS